MKYSDFRRWLERQGVTLTPSRKGSSHFKAEWKGRISIFPFHGAREIGQGLVERIKKDLGLK